jgi:hypothetical protein
MAHRLFLGNAAAMWIACAAAFGQTPAQADYASLNAAFGITVWADDNLWDDSDAQVAARLQWPRESRTNTDSSYRLYAGPAVRVLGARPFSLALYGRNEMASQISMVFANKGDSNTRDPFTNRPNLDYKKDIAADANEIHNALAKVLGPPRADQFGQGVRTRERVERWDWKGHAILLAAPRGEYVAVRIVPTAVADGEASARVTGEELRAKLKERVERRPNGDVVLTDIPMVNQGPKGYCVPATWERALRYVGIPADMYVLALAGQTDAGGGTSVDAMSAGAKEVVARNGRRLVPTGGRITTRSVARFIDEGLPILWGMFAVEDVEKAITIRTAQRAQTTDWAAYAKALEPVRRDARRIRPSRDDGHMCMIIGYNAKTDEIAISDSWGPQFAERWITTDEANAISQNEFTVIQ